MFLCEIISLSIQEELKDDAIYNFIHTSLLSLNKESLSGEYFDLWFLINFTKVLGVGPDCANIENNTAIMFNPLDGIFYTNNLRKLDSFWDEETSELLFNFLHINVEKLNSLSLSSSCYRLLIDNILDYYSLHVSELNYKKPIAVYKELL